MQMTIRRATLDDVPPIKYIAESRLRQGSVPSSSGFFRLDLTEADYRERIDGNPLVFVAEYGNPVGFLIGYTSERLRNLAATNRNAREDELIACALGFKDPFSYVDLFAVLKSHERGDIGQALDDRFLEEIESLGISRVYGGNSRRKCQSNRILQRARAGNCMPCDVQGSAVSHVYKEHGKNQAAETRKIA